MIVLVVDAVLLTLLLRHLVARVDSREVDVLFLFHSKIMIYAGTKRLKHVTINELINPTLLLLLEVVPQCVRSLNPAIRVEGAVVNVVVLDAVDGVAGVLKGDKEIK